MKGPVAALLGDGERLHLQHGPIDLIIGVDTKKPADRQAAFHAGTHRFKTILEDLVAELPMLRSPIRNTSALPAGTVARRMDQVTRPLATARYVTRMSAVAGAVADEVLASMVDAVPIDRAYVNNGGDIALHLGPGAQYDAGIAGLHGDAHGCITILATMDVRGIATSGQGGRSLSLGIADSVTVLAKCAAAADAAATLIANTVDLPGHPAITRKAAVDIDPDTDLIGLNAVTKVGPLSPDDIDLALCRGGRTAQEMLAAEQICGAALFLQGMQHIVGPVPTTPNNQTELVQHA